MNKGFGFIWILMACCSTSCDYFNVQRVNKYDVKEAQLNDFKKEQLKNYPQIFDCESMSDPKTCFEQQLSAQIEQGLHFAKMSNTHSSNEDTLWLTVQVTNKGMIKVVSKTAYSKEHKQIVQKIDSTLQQLSPIKPAHKKGVKVNCNFRLPVVIK